MTIKLNIESRRIVIHPRTIKTIRLSITLLIALLLGFFFGYLHRGYSLEQARTDGAFEGKLAAYQSLIQAVNPGPERIIYTSGLTNCTFINSPIRIIPCDHLSFLTANLSALEPPVL